MNVVCRFIVFIVFGPYYPRYFEKSIRSPVIILASQGLTVSHPRQADPAAPPATCAACHVDRVARGLQPGRDDVAELDELADLAGAGDPVVVPIAARPAQEAVCRIDHGAARRTGWAAAHFLGSAATGFIAAKDAVALRAWGIGPSKDRRAAGRNAWLGLGYQREFCTATTGFMGGSIPKHVETQWYSLKTGLDDDRGRDGGELTGDDDFDRMRPGRQRV